jgi:thiamine-monophosphate kinase
MLVGRYLRPEPRVALAPHLLAHASAAMDVSDGLVKDCARLARASGLAASLDCVRLPLSQPLLSALARQPDLIATALTGGDDYEVLAAVSPGEASAFQAAAQACGVPVSEIGRLSAGTGISVLGADGQPMSFTRPGWDHFPH